MSRIPILKKKGWKEDKDGLIYKEGHHPDDEKEREIPKSSRKLPYDETERDTEK